MREIKKKAVSLLEQQAAQVLAFASESKENVKFYSTLALAYKCNERVRHGTVELHSVTVCKENGRVYLESLDFEFERDDGTLDSISLEIKYGCSEMITEDLDNSKDGRYRVIVKERWLV